MVELQLLTGMRPGEVCGIRPIDVDRTGAVWSIQDDTFADIRFNYEDKFLKSASVRFNKPVHLVIHSTPPVETDLKSIEYDFRGLPVRVETAPDSSGSLITLRRHLEFDKKSSAFFAGRPFVPFGKAGSKNIVRDISFFNREKKPGLLVALEDGVELRFSSESATKQNWVRLGAPSTVQFDEITYRHERGPRANALASASKGVMASLPRPSPARGHWPRSGKR
jgi:hypothetical protein